MTPPTPRPAPAFGPRTGGVRVPVLSGLPPRGGVLSFDAQGVHVDGARAFGAPWTAVAELRARRGQVVIGAEGRRLAVAVSVDGVGEPALAAPLLRLLEEARAGSVQVSGSAHLDFWNASDRLRDEFDHEDDPVIPAVVALAFLISAVVFSALLPVLIAIATASPVPAGTFVLDGRLSPVDPRVLLMGLGAGGLVAALAVRVAGGRHALAWARGTLRGWHGRGILPASAMRLLARIVHRPALSAAAVLAGALLAVPSVRTHTAIDAGGIRIVREVPFLDAHRPWNAVTQIATVSAPFDRHPSGVAVVIGFADGARLSTLGESVRGGTDRELFERATAWRASSAR